MWDDYPPTYRAAEVEHLVRAIKAGESAALVGLSGAGKSNVLGFIANAAGVAARLPNTRLVAVDCNRLREPSPNALFAAMRRGLGQTALADGTRDPLDALDDALAAGLREKTFAKVCFVLDRFDSLTAQNPDSLFGNLRSLRDAHKFKLSFITGTRRPLDARTEFAELVYANTIWLGCLGESDARWNVARYAARKELVWGDEVATALIGVSRGYASFLRASCEACADMGDPNAAAAHPAVRARVDEFWADAPSEEEIRLSGLAGLPLLYAGRAATFNTSQLTSKEMALLDFLQAHPNAVCEKDDIIRAVWSEDKAFGKGIRDDSLAQLARRLREKIEPDPNAPRWVITVPGRGYKFVAG